MWGVPTLNPEGPLFQALLFGNLRLFKKARRYLSRSLGIFADRNDSLGVAETRAYTGHVDFYQGRLREAADHFGHAAQELEKAGDYWERHKTLSVLVALCLVRGDFSEALDFIERMEDFTSGLSSQEPHMAVHVGRSLTHALLGQFEKSRFSLEKALGIYGRSHYLWTRLSFLFISGRVKLLQDDWKSALQDLRGALEIMDEQKIYSFYTVHVYPYLIQALLQGASDPGIGEKERREFLGQARSMLRGAGMKTRGFPIHYAQWRIVKGLLLMCRGRRRAADRILHTGIAQLEAMGARGYLAEAHLAIRHMLLALGEEGEAAKQAERAQQVLRELGGPGEQPAALSLPLEESSHTVESNGEDAVVEGEPALSSETLEMNSILEASRLLASSLDQDQVLERIVDISMVSLGAERAMLMIRKEEEGKGDKGRNRGGEPSLQVVLTRNLDPQELNQENFSLCREIVRKVEHTGKPEIIGDAQKDLQSGEQGAAIPADLKSILCVPLVDHGKSIGILYLDNRLLSHLFTERHLRFLESLTSFAVVAMKNARSYEETCRQRDEIKRLQEKLQEEVVYLTEEIRKEHHFEEMVGMSPAMQEVFQFIEIAAGVNEPVLILGETGTGKELVARAIHRRSPRGQRPIIKVNCAAIPEGLLESELFGHEKGAFTGAVQKKVGRFELANGGTLFLDEIGEMSPALQAKLLRVLEHKEFERLGGTRTLRVDVNIISATNRNLKGEIEAGRFREDLYYRLNVLPVRLPPLRERNEDIPLLLSYFISKLSKKFNKEVKDVDQASVDAALRYAWPGNVREMEHLVERAVALSSSTRLKLAPMILFEPENGETVSRTAGLTEVPSGDFRTIVDDYKKRVILDTLHRTQGSKKDAARILGLSPSAFSNMLKRMDIDI